MIRVFAQLARQQISPVIRGSRRRGMSRVMGFQGNAKVEVLPVDELRTVLSDIHSLASREGYKVFLILHPGRSELHK